MIFAQFFFLYFCVHTWAPPHMICILFDLSNALGSFFPRVSATVRHELCSPLDIERGATRLLVNDEALHPFHDLTPRPTFSCRVAILAGHACARLLSGLFESSCRAAMCLWGWMKLGVMLSCRKSPIHVVHYCCLPGSQLAYKPAQRRRLLWGRLVVLPRYHGLRSSIL